MSNFMEFGDRNFINLDQVLEFWVEEKAPDKWELNIRMVGDAGTIKLVYDEYNKAQRVVNRVMDRNYYGKK